MITQEQKEKEVKSKLDSERELDRQAISEGLIAERLLVNSEWLWFKKKIQDKVDQREKDRNGLFEDALKNTVTVEQKLVVFDTMKAYNAEIENFKYLISLPERVADEGRLAEDRINRKE